MSPSAVINLEEFRKRRETKSAVRPMPSPMSSMGFWSPVWVWVMVWPS